MHYSHVIESPPLSLAFLSENVLFISFKFHGITEEPAQHSPVETSNLLDKCPVTGINN